MLSRAPTFSTSKAAEIAREHFAFDGTATALASERDQNFLIETRAGDRMILKVANALEERALLEAQQAVLSHLAPAFGLTPRVVLASNGSHLCSVRGEDESEHLAWAITHMNGELLAKVTRRSPHLYEDFGRRIGDMSNALRTFDHPAIHRTFHWDLATARETVSARRHLVCDAAVGDAIDRIMAQFREYTAPLLSGLRTSAIHDDLNDHNVLVRSSGDLYARGQHIAGFVDFGDIVHSYTIADLAIAAAYMCLESGDPLAVISAMAHGHHHVSPLAEDEMAALFGLVAVRLCVSACMAADQLAQQPQNSYLGVSQGPVSRTLPVLANLSFPLATAIVRDACGLDAVPSSARVQHWLGANANTFASIFAPDVRREPFTHIDLSIDSPLIAGDSTLNAHPALTRRIDALMADEGTRIGIGGYDEPRFLNTSAHFASGGAPDAERRTIHMGLDFFAAAGTPVHAPLDGTVFAFADNDRPQDYGPVILLQHVTGEGDAFHTLYGHLSRESLGGLAIGQRVARGEPFATLGDVSVNGGWTPHLHLQLFTDQLGLGTELPGIVRPSERRAWRSICPDPSVLAGVPLRKAVDAPIPKAESLARRRAVFGANLSIAYRDPVRTVRGWKQYLFDDEGRRYLDAYNNVPHVGHAHPRVVDAAVRQMALLNTNTRYLNDQLAEYAERLTATLPSPLDVCMLVNSASEANELALRLARAHTKARDMIVLDAAYHGNTTSLIDISPYKHDGPGGTGAPYWVHTIPLPDDYRGPIRRGEHNVGARHAKVVEALAPVLEGKLCGFIAETCPSVGGQLILPDGYLTNIYSRVRAAGGVCIADEVQTGLGRMGTHFWAFEAHGVVPDIVVMGKPLGNGHPMAAVVTTRAIADSFDNGMEFFSTFGGNNVSCAVGLAVLDVLRDEGLQAHALAVGERVLSALRPLADRHDIVGDVRGSGLFLGVELVRDRETLEPAGEEASFIANRMRERGILLGTDGPFHNVVKIRPPMPFDDSDADRLVSTLEEILKESF